MLESQESLIRDDQDSESQFPVKAHKSFRTRMSEWYSGWQFTLALVSFTKLLLPVFNLGFIIWAVVHQRLDGNRGTLFDGNCKKVQKLSTGLHLLVNILSMTLLAGSGWVTSLISNTLVANTPQLIFPILYFAFNGIFTTMTLAAEWSRYANHQKGLRVSSNPELSQRSSYFLSLPYRFALPSLAFSAVLHWLTSQSLFLVGIKSYTAALERNPKRDVPTCGHSSPATVSSIAVGVMMIVWLVGFSFKRVGSGMPVAGSCSLAIAAACHPTLTFVGEDYAEEEGKLGTELLPVGWGVTYVDADGEGQCSFASEVTMPDDGKYIV
ncbi:hypothetical protein BBP40_008926 [Aspergillus hancockii]|nr:hypothetical protein BBP40_008926 [Aspergillus hancockii]